MNGESTLTQKCYRGQTLVDELVVDIHMHLGPWQAFPIANGGSAEAMLRQMDLLGIDYGLVSSHLAIGPDWREGNRQAYQIHHRFAPRLLAYFTPNPRYSWDEMQPEIDRWAAEGILMGFKLHPDLHGYSCTDKKCFPIYEYANERGLPILSHTWQGEQVDNQHPLRGLAQRYPDAIFIHAHAANSWSACELLTEVAMGQDNVYLDITGSMMYYGLLEEMANRIGAAHILFGTDMPFMDARAQIGRVLTSQLSDDEKRLILGLNAAQIYKLPAH